MYSLSDVQPLNSKPTTIGARKRSMRVWVAIAVMILISLCGVAMRQNRYIGICRQPSPKQLNQIGWRESSAGFWARQGKKRTNRLTDAATLQPPKKRKLATDGTRMEHGK